MKRLIVLACVLLIACESSNGGNPNDPSPVPFPLPAGAPSDAAAPAGTSRITITTIEILAPNGSRVMPDRLRVTDPLLGYNMRVWIFCPEGLEGPQGSGWNAETLQFHIRQIDVTTNTGGTFSGGLELDPGYNVLESSLSQSSKGGRQRVTTEILRNFAVVARNEFTATFTE